MADEPAVAVDYPGTEHRTEVQHMLVRLGVADVPEVDPGAWDYELLNR